MAANKRSTRKVGEIVSWIAAAWAAAFALVHAYWALGGGFGLPSDLRLWDHAPLLVVDVLAIPLCVGLAILARSVVALGLDRGRRLLRITFVAAAATLFAAHSAESVWRLTFGGADLQSMDERQRLSMLLYEPWWFAGAVVFAALAITVSISHGLVVNRNRP